MDLHGVRHLLAASELSPSPSEAHGILCGLICGGDPQALDTWLDQIVAAPGPGAGDLLAAEARAGLAQVAELTLAEIRGPDMGFTLLIPDESDPLLARATALYDWVRGFLFALGLQGLGEGSLSGPAREVLHDFTQITQMDLQALQEGEEDEAALTEIVEFVRVAAMLIYQDRVLDQARALGPVGPTAEAGPR